MDIPSYRRHAISLHRQLSHAEEVSLADAIAQGSDEALHALVDAHLILAFELAERYQEQGGYDTDQLPRLVRLANNGLYRAARAYSQGNGKKFLFRKYAPWWIRQYLTKTTTRDD